MDKQIIYFRGFFDEKLSEDRNEDKTESWSIRIEKREIERQEYIRIKRVPCCYDKHFYEFMGWIQKVDNSEIVYIDECYDLSRMGIDTEEGIVNYLSMGMFRGIERKQAWEIVNKYGLESIELLEGNTEKLYPLFDYEDIDEWQEYIDKEKLFLDFIKENIRLGLSLEEYRSVYRKLRVIKRRSDADLFIAETGYELLINPYMLIDMAKISFVEADEIALSLLPASSWTNNMDVRIRAAFTYVMKEFQTNGHTGMEYRIVCLEVYKLLNFDGNGNYVCEVSKKKINEICTELIEDGSLVCMTMDYKNYYLYTEFYYNVEKQICDSIYRISKNIIKEIDEIEYRILAQECINNIDLDDSQREAVITALEEPFCVIYGGPGTGKTKMLEVIVNIYKEAVDNRIVLMAPTGKAAMRMREVTKLSAGTIHSVLGINYEVDDEEKSSNIGLIENSLVIIDEFSMVDAVMASILFGRIGRGTRIVLVGDADQLPSVGAGSVLRDIIESGVVCARKLERGHRAKGNLIYENANLVNNRKTNFEEGENFSVHWIDTEMKSKTAREKVADLYVKRYKEYGAGNTILLIPVNKYELGVRRMNEILQSKCNPKDSNRKELKYDKKIFRMGDPVINTKNDQGILNGETGIIIGIEDGRRSKKILVKFADKEVWYKNNPNSPHIKNLSLSYAMTVHKSQGSEYDSVLFLMLSQYRNMLSKSIPYVAISRAKKMVDVICDGGLAEAIEGVSEVYRITLLPHFFAQWKETQNYQRIGLRVGRDEEIPFY